MLFSWTYLLVDESLSGNLPGVLSSVARGCRARVGFRCGAASMAFDVEFKDGGAMHERVYDKSG